MKPKDYSAYSDGYYWYDEPNRGIVIVKKEKNTLWAIGRGAILGGDLLESVVPISGMTIDKGNTNKQ